MVEDVRPHPNADRLRLCTVNDGSAARHNVVCGAPNVAAGRKYPFARVGATLPGGLKIEPRKLRGETSEGMLCSARELGLGQEHDGLLELATAATPGTPLLKALPLADHRLIVDVGPNRPDLLCHKGIARELSVSYSTPFRLPVIPHAGAVDILPSRRGAASGEVGGVEIVIEDVESCPRLPRRPGPRGAGRCLAGMAQTAARSRRRALHQQRRRRHQLGHAGAQSADARVRRGKAAVGKADGASCRRG